MTKSVLIVSASPNDQPKEYVGCDVIINYGDGNFLVNGKRAHVSNIGPLIDSLNIESADIVGYLSSNLSLVEGWQNIVRKAFSEYGVMGVYSDMFNSTTNRIYPLLSFDVSRGWQSPFVFMNMALRPQISLFFTEAYVQDVLTKVPIMKVVEPLVSSD